MKFVELLGGGGVGDIVADGVGDIVTAGVGVASDGEGENEVDDAVGDSVGDGVSMSGLSTESLKEPCSCGGLKALVKIRGLMTRICVRRLSSYKFSKLFIKLSRTASTSKIAAVY